MSEATPQSPKAVMNLLKIIHGALIFSPLVFFLLIYNIGDEIGMMNEEYYNTLIIALPLFAGFTLLLSSIISKKRLATLDPSLPLAKKLGFYTSVVIMKNAPKEFGAFVLGIGFLLTGGELFLVIGAIMIVTIFFDRPTTTRLKLDMDLSEQEYRELTS